MLGKKKRELNKKGLKMAAKKKTKRKAKTTK
jgi:hypothetical protein